REEGPLRAPWLLLPHGRLDERPDRARQALSVRAAAAMSAMQELADFIRHRSAALKGRVIHGESHSMRTCHEETTRTAGASGRDLFLLGLRPQQADDSQRRACQLRPLRRGAESAACAAVESARLAARHEGRGLTA